MSERSELCAVGCDYRVWRGALATAACGGAAVGVLVAALPDPTHPALWFGLVLVVGLTASALRACGFSPWLPTRSRDLERVRELLDLRSGERFVDLGCGDGRVASYLSRTTDAHCVGVELSLFHYLLARLRWLLRGCPRNLELRWGDLFDADLTTADAVYVYATPTTLNARLRPKLDAELRAGARVLIYKHVLEGPAPERCQEEWPALRLHRVSARP